MQSMTGFRQGMAVSVRAGTAEAPPPDAWNRLIMLLDYDSFYARCMQQAYPPLRGRPVGIRGPAKGTAIIAASTEAKACGVKVGMHILDATRRCPGFVAVHADMDMYGEMCARSLAVLRRYTEKLEPFSIDEAFLDVTDLAATFGDPHMLAQQIKHDLRVMLGPTITCSIGIGPNKLLAKLVSGFHKPDGITHITPEEIPALLREVPLAKFCGIGARVERRLQRLGIYTAAQLGRMPPTILQREFGILGRVYWLWGQGIDLAPVAPYAQQAAEKSMSHHLTLPSPVSDRQALDGILLRLCERLGRRLRGKGMLTRQVHVGIGWDWDAPAVTAWGGHRNLPASSDDTMAIYDAVQHVLPPGAPPVPARRVQVAVTRLSQGVLQLSLLEDRLRDRALQQAMDAINERFGDWSILRGTGLHDPFPARTGPPGHGLCRRFTLPDA